MKNDFAEKLLMHLFIYAKQLLFTSPQEQELVEQVFSSTANSESQKVLVTDMFNSKLQALSAEEKSQFKEAMLDELAKKGNEFYLAMTV